MSGFIDRATNIVWNSASWCDGTLRALPYANNLYTYTYENVGTPVYNFVVPNLASFYSYTVPAIKKHYYMSGAVGIIVSYVFIRSYFFEQKKN